LKSPTKYQKNNAVPALDNITGTQENGEGIKENTIFQELTCIPGKSMRIFQELTCIPGKLMRITVCILAMFKPIDT
jgi:hypothetical protein